MPRGARPPGCSGGRGCFTWGGVVLEGGIDQREVQQDRGIGAGGVGEEVALLGLALVLWAGLHAGERQPSASAVHLSLLQHLVGRGPQREPLLPGRLVHALENLGRLQPRPTAQCQHSPGPVRGLVQLRGRQRMPVVCNAVPLVFRWGIQPPTPIWDCCCWVMQVPEPRGPQWGNTSASRPYAVSPQSLQGGSGGTDTDRPGAPPSSEQLFPLGPSTSTPFPTKGPGRSMWVRVCHFSLPLGTQVVWASGPVDLSLDPGAQPG